MSNHIAFELSILPTGIQSEVLPKNPIGGTGAITAGTAPARHDVVICIDKSDQFDLVSTGSLHTTERIVKDMIMSWLRCLTNVSLVGSSIRFIWNPTNKVLSCNVGP